MAGESIISFVPFHLSAVDRSSKVCDWVKSWVGEEVLFLEPEDWFERGHDLVGGKVREDGFWIPEFRKGCYLWVPPPAAANVVLEERRVAWLKSITPWQLRGTPKMYAMGRQLLGLHAKPDLD
jgi:hypothetical protein